MLLAVFNQLPPKKSVAEPAKVLKNRSTFATILHRFTV
jgi:hypothetical protein